MLTQRGPGRKRGSSQRSQLTDGEETRFRPGKLYGELTKLADELAFEIYTSSLSSAEKPQGWVLPRPCRAPPAPIGCGSGEKAIG